jgi:hypothetical protein
VLARQSDDELRQMVDRHIIDDRRRQELGLINVCSCLKGKSDSSRKYHHYWDTLLDFRIAAGLIQTPAHDDRSRRLWLTFFDRRANARSSSAEESSRDLTAEGVAQILRTTFQDIISRRACLPQCFSAHLRARKGAARCRFAQGPARAIPGLIGENLNDLAKARVSFKPSYGS